MKKQKIIFLILIILLLIPVYSYATQEEILQSQSERLNINEFINKANEYTKEVFEGMDAGTILNNAILGNVDNKSIFNNIIKLFGNEIKDTISVIR